MININLNNVSRDDEGVKSGVSKLLNDIFENQINNAFRHSYFVTDEQSEVLNDIFKPRHVFQRSNGKLHESSHPIFAVLNEYSNFDASNNIKHWASQGLITLSIGDSTSMKLNAHHNCLLLDNSRDLFRVANNKGPDNVTKYAQGRNCKPHTQCKDGCHNCYFKADKAVAVHSLYDLGFDDLATTFANHDLDTLIVYLYVPLVLYDDNLSDHDIAGFKVYPHSNDKNKLIFTLDDFSTPYIHDKTNWSMYAKCGKIEHPDFDIAIEHARSYGPLHVINMQRIRKMNGPMPIIAPLASRMKNYYRVPDMVHAAANGFKYRQYDNETQYFIVPCHIVDGILAYALRAKDESYKYTEIAAVASGLRHQIVIGNSTYRKPWDVHQNDYRDIVLSLFILGAINRKDRTQIISQCFNELKTINNMGFIQEKFKRACNFFSRSLFKNKETNCNDQGYYIDDWQVIKFVDKVYTQSYITRDSNQGIYHSKVVAPAQYCDTDTSIVDHQSTTPDDLVSVCTTYESDCKEPDLNVNSDYIQIPRAFKAVGHCAMRAFWDTLPRHQKKKQSQILRESFDLLILKGHDHQTVTKYIVGAEWDNDCSADIIGLLSNAHNHSVEIVNSDGVVLQQFGSAPYCKITYDNKHYASSMRGGSIHKFKSLAIDIAQLINDGDSIHDVSAAPGFFINMIYDECLALDKYPKVFASIYKGDDAARYTQSLDNITIQQYKQDYNNNFPDKKFNFLINDAARDINTEQLTEQFCH